MIEVEQELRVSFGRESMATVVGDIAPLAARHWEEVGHYRDMPLEVDYARYAAAERLGQLRLFTVRAQHTLVGYGVFLLQTALHYADVVLAQEATIYVTPEYRGCGLPDDFEDWIEARLRSEGVQIITKHVKAKHNPKRALARVRLLRRKGYELQDYLVTKRL